MRFGIFVGAAVSLLAVGIADGQQKQRVVSLGGSVTEVVLALGAGDRLVGVDQSSASIPGAEALPQVSNFRSLSAEGVLSLTPSVVVATTDAGPPAALAQLKAAGVDVHLVPAAHTIDEAAAKIRAVGVALGMETAADALATRVTSEARAAVAAAEQLATRSGRRPKALFIYARGAGALFVSGTGTSATEMIRLAGAENAVTAFEGFRPLTAEAVVAASPDVIIVPERGLASIGGVAGLRRLPGVALTPAARAGRIVAIDDALLLGFGPRLGEAVRTLSHAIHGGMAHATHREP
jgi:iron complex transport system substrate-binding protein